MTQKKSSVPKKFPRKTFSQVRRKRLRLAISEFEKETGLSFRIYRKRLSRIFDTAEHLLGMSNVDTTIIFVGQGMRPLFEAVNTINEIRGRYPRRNLIYVVTPEFSREATFHYLKAAGKEALSGTIAGARAVEVHEVDLIKKRLLRHGKGITKKGKILVVDYVSPEFSIGSNWRAVKNAVKSLNPSAEIIPITHESVGCHGIYESEHLAHPTVKDYEGKLTASPKKSDRDIYLLFQRELQKYIFKMKKTK